MKWKVQENTAGGAKLLHTIYLDKWEKATMELHVAHEQLNHSQDPSALPDMYLAAFDYKKMKSQQSWALAGPTSKLFFLVFFFL